MRLPTIRTSAIIRMMLIWWKFIYFHYGAIGDNLFLARFVRKFTCEPNINSAISAEAILIRLLAANTVYNVLEMRE